MRAVNCTQNVDLGDLAVQAPLAGQMVEARMSADLHSEHQRSLQKALDKRRRIGRYPVCSKKLIDLICARRVPC